MSLRALEFYSGIGAFAQAAANFDIEIAAAFDQSQWANQTYAHNHGLTPSPRNLDSVKPEYVPAASLWWMSPPCTPFSRRGKQKDEEDHRARSFLHLIEMLALKRPEHLCLENVEGFRQSAVHALLIKKLESLGYRHLEIRLCASDFGVPMLRPRLFVVASRTAQLQAPPPPLKSAPSSLQEYLFERGQQFDCSPAMLERYAPVLNRVDADMPGSYLICFTSGYHRCRQASGSLIETGGGGARFVSPAEILKLLGFGAQYTIPPAVPLEVAYRLVGNSVDVRAIDYLLANVLKLERQSAGGIGL
ncbi:MAG: DNA cytosine methyltransferase [Cyanobacteria bacterium REEB67]|nr:DNA cytosine methyltransferase [Cyanobacteria bacterium REEB67]